MFITGRHTVGYAQSVIGRILLITLLVEWRYLCQFQNDGKLLDSMERLRSDVKVGATTSTASFSKRALILSSPTAF